MSGNPAHPGIIKTLGPAGFLHLHKTAFLCSRRCPADIVLKAYDWAIARREAGHCVMSGFHSQIEKDVLHYLLKGSQPVILALARGMKKRWEAELQQALDERRLLVITPFPDTVTRASQETAEHRNRLMLELTDDLMVAYAQTGGKLEKMLAQQHK